MGKIFEYFGFIFYFFSNEHDPIHVHVKHGSEECIFDITLRIIQAKAIGNLSVELTFNDNSRQNINVGAFIKAHPHPQYNKYLDEMEFKKFSLDDGNIVWGEDWDLVFPIEQLHADYIA